MADTQETIADIIAEMRALSNPISDGIIAINGRIIADRLEAAHKRERETADAKISDLQSRVKLWTDRSAELVKKCDEHYANAHRRKRGDAAKLREAVVEIIDYLEPIRKWTAPSKENHAELTALFAAVDTVYTKAKAALAAPPRNCERFGSSTQARAEWYKTEVLPRVEGVVSGVEPPFVDWLFAPATEQEGGTDGNE